MAWRTCATSSWARPENPIADIRALPGIRYHLSRAGDLSMLVAPPYDVIPESEVARYDALSPYNVIRLTRPGRDYDRAARTSHEWLVRGTLTPDPPSMYVPQVRLDARRRPHTVAPLRPQPYEDTLA